jgi:hypothetical protein
MLGIPKLIESNLRYNHTSEQALLSSAATDKRASPHVAQ